VHEFGIPRLQYTGRQVDGRLVLDIRQVGDTDYEVPVTVSLRYADGSTEEQTLVVDAAHVERTLPLRGALRSWALNEDRGALAHFDQR
jgi:hypothetical protein